MNKDKDEIKNIYDDYSPRKSGYPENASMTMKRGKWNPNYGSDEGNSDDAEAWYEESRDKFPTNMRATISPISSK